MANSDLPELTKLQEKLNQADFQKFPQMKVSFKAISFCKFVDSPSFQDKLIAQVNHMLDVDISELMGIVPASDTDPVIRGGAFDDVKDQVSPFGFEKCEGDPFLCSHLALTSAKCTFLPVTHRAACTRPNRCS